MTATVRPANPSDAPAIATIYAAGVASGRATVLTRAPSAEQLSERVASAQPCHTWLVAEESSRIVGWAASMPYLPQQEYAGVADFSVYVAPERQGQGVGPLLMTALLAEASASGLYKLTSRVFSDNLASRRMLARLGFREVGTHVRHALVDGEWRDVVILEVLLGVARG